MMIDTTTYHTNAFANKDRMGHNGPRWDEQPRFAEQLREQQLHVHFQEEEDSWQISVSMRSISTVYD